MGGRFWLVLTVLVWAVQVEGAGVSGVLDGGGDTGRSGKYVLLIGTLGLPVQTGELRSASFSVTPGILPIARSEVEPKPGDFNGDGGVDFTDFVIFAQGYGKARGQDGYLAQLDLNEDGEIGFGDFVLFAQKYGT